MKRTIEDWQLEYIANAIREKGGTKAGLTVDEMVDAIYDLQTEGTGNLQSKNIMPTGEEIIVTPDSGFDGLESVTVEGDPNLIEENIREGVEIYGKMGTFAGSGLIYKILELEFIDSGISV